MNQTAPATSTVVSKFTYYSPYADTSNETETIIACRPKHPVDYFQCQGQPFCRNSTKSVQNIPINLSTGHCKPYQSHKLDLQMCISQTEMHCRPSSIVCAIVSASLAIRIAERSGIGIEHSSSPSVRTCVLW